MVEKWSDHVRLIYIPPVVATNSVLPMPHDTSLITFAMDTQLCPLVFLSPYDKNAKIYFMTLLKI